MEEKLRKLRKKSGFTQEELALKLNVTRQTISNWERGYSIPDFENLKVISTFYKVPISYFMDDKEHEVYLSKIENNSIDNQSFYLLLLTAVASFFTPLAAFVLIYLTLELKNKLKFKVYHRFLFLGIFLAVINLLIFIVVSVDFLIFN